MLKRQNVGSINLLVSVLGVLPNYTYISIHLLMKCCNGSQAVFREKFRFSYHSFECYTSISFNLVAHIADIFSPVVFSHYYSESYHTPA